VPCASVFSSFIKTWIIVLTSSIQGLYTVFASQNKPFHTNSWYSSFCLPLSPLILWSQPGGLSPRAKHMLLSIALIQIQRAGIIAGVPMLSHGFVPLWLPSARHTPFQSTAFEGCLFLSNLRTSPMMWTFNKPLHAPPRTCRLHCVWRDLQSHYFILLFICLFAFPCWLELFSLRGSSGYILSKWCLTGSISSTCQMIK